jgi:hypothetical protein
MGLLSLNDVTTVLQTGSLTTDQQLYYQFLINAAEAAIQRLCGRKFVRATYTDYLNSNPTDEITLRETPVASITAIYMDAERVFGADKLLDPSTYQLKLDGYSNDSESGIVYRIKGTWNPGDSWCQLPGRAPILPRRVPGCIKVVYPAGFATCPYDLRMAICHTIAYLRTTTANGAGFRSESDEGYSYSLNTPDEELLKIGSVSSVVARLRRFVS